MLALIAAVAALSGQDADPDRIITSITPQDVRNLMRDLGGGSDALLRNDPDGFLMPVTFASGLDAVVQTYNCEGEGEAIACREYSLRTEFHAATPADADRIADDLRTGWLDAHAQGDVIVASRMDFTHGGVGVGHIGLTFETYDRIASRGMALTGD